MNPWDLNAERRREQIRSGLDLSYTHVLTPAILSALPAASTERRPSVLDAGCGTGVLASLLWKAGWDVVGVDSSSKMIEIAQEDNAEREGVRFLRAELVDLANLFAPKSFDAAVANMSLTGIVDLAPVLQKIGQVIKTQGPLVITDVHPWFWRKYKDREDLPYCGTVAVIESLTISLDPEPLPAPITVVYRPLSELCRALSEAKFLVDRIDEPKPPIDVAGLYPEPWRYPRFIVLVAYRR